MGAKQGIYVAGCHLDYFELRQLSFGLCIPAQQAGMVRSLLLFFSLPISALAETIQNRWKVPDGGKSDLSQTFTSGQTLPVSWKSMNESTNDLWVTTWNYNEVQYSSLIARRQPSQKSKAFTAHLSMFRKHRHLRRRLLRLDHRHSAFPALQVSQVRPTL